MLSFRKHNHSLLRSCTYRLGFWCKRSPIFPGILHRWWFPALARLSHM